VNLRAQPVTLSGVTLPARTALAAALLAALAGCSSTAAAPKPTSTPAPVISNIPRPNAACTPAGDRKLSFGDDLSEILFFGYIDGKQVEMLVGNAMNQAIAGHKVEYVWYCPLRSKWQ
jgi:hypothetical protein